MKMAVDIARAWKDSEYRKTAEGLANLLPNGPTQLTDEQVEGVAGVSLRTCPKWTCPTH